MAKNSSIPETLLEIAASSITSELTDIIHEHVSTYVSEEQDQDALNLKDRLESGLEAELETASEAEKLDRAAIADFARAEASDMVDMAVAYCLIWLLEKAVAPHSKEVLEVAEKAAATITHKLDV